MLANELAKSDGEPLNGAIFLPPKLEIKLLNVAVSNPLKADEKYPNHAVDKMI